MTDLYENSPYVQSPGYDIPYWGEGVDVKSAGMLDRKHLGLSHKGSVTLVDDDAGLQNAIEYVYSKGMTGYDLETTGLKPYRDRIVLIQLGDEEHQFLIWHDAVTPSKISELLEDPSVLKYGVNLKFDIGCWLASHGLHLRPVNFADVQIIEQVLTCGLYSSVGQSMSMSSMAQLARHWLGLNLPKDEALRTGWGEYNSIHDLPEEKVYYAADDVIIPKKILYKQKPWIGHLGLVQTINLEHRYLPFLADMEIRGITIDQELWTNLAQEAASEARQARRTLDELFEVTVDVRLGEAGEVSFERDKNYSSPQQLQNMIRDWMWDNVGVDVIFNNAHYKNSLMRWGKINFTRLDILFNARMEPDPDNPEKKKKVAYPEMSDVVDTMWDLYRHFLPPESFVISDTDSKTLQLMKIIWESDKVDSVLSTEIGLPPILVDPLLQLRKSEKLVGTYGLSWLEPAPEGLLDDDGRVRTSFAQTALSTGRLSSSPNFQNPPADSRYRQAFRAAPGMVFVGSDWSQIEPRVIAHMSQDPVYMRTFWSEQPGTAGFQRWCDATVTERLDLYTEVGKEVGVIPPHFTVLDTKGDDKRSIPPKEEGKKGRDQAKITNLSLGYGTGKPKFHLTLIKDTKVMQFREETDKLYDDYWGSLSTVHEMLDKLSFLADPSNSPRRVFHPHTNGPVTWAETLYGRKRFYRKGAGDWWTTGRNMPIQGTAGGDILKLTACELMEWARDTGIPGGLVNLIHDELLFETTPEVAPLVAEKMEYVMREVGEQLCYTVPISSEAYIEEYWVK